MPAFPFSENQSLIQLHIYAGVGLGCVWNAYYFGIFGIVFDYNNAVYKKSLSYVQI